MRRPPVIGWLAATKLYWGMVAVVIVGAWLSPVDANGGDIFLSLPNLTDVLRQVSITGIVAVGMTLVILTGGIDLSVGSVMALAATLVAMLLTMPGETHASALAVPCVTIACAGIGWMIGKRSGVPASARRLVTGRRLALAAGFGIGAFFLFRLGIGEGFGVASVLVAALAIGLVAGGVNGLIVGQGRLQPFIATLAMMVTALGVARVMAGEDQSVYPIYPGRNAPLAIDRLRSALFGVPVPGLIFLGTVLVFAILLARFRFGRQIYAIGGNEKAAHLAGIDVAHVKLWVYGLSGALAGLGGLLYAAQYRQGKPDAGTGLELDAIAAVVIGGASLTGGRGTLFGTLVSALLLLGAATTVSMTSKSVSASRKSRPPNRGACCSIARCARRPRSTPKSR